jgi:hypothetical protein
MPLSRGDLREPHQLTQKPPPTLASILQSLAAAEIANIRPSTVGPQGQGARDHGRRDQNSDAATSAFSSSFDEDGGQPAAQPDPDGCIVQATRRS